MKKIIACILVIMSTAMTVKAQSASGAGSQQVALNMSNAIDIALVGSSSSQLNMNFTTISSLITGVQSSDQQLRVRSNKNFKVTAAPSSNFFSYTGGSVLNNLIPVNLGAIQVKVTANQTGGQQASPGWMNFGLLNNPVTLLNNCDPGSNQTFTVKYKTAPGATIASGVYSIDIVYTATQI